MNCYRYSYPTLLELVYSSEVYLGNRRAV